MRGRQEKMKTAGRTLRERKPYIVQRDLSVEERNQESGYKMEKEKEEYG